MKFCTVVPEICRGQVHGARKERRIIIIIIIIRNGAKTISPPNIVWFRLNYRALYAKVVSTDFVDVG
jgi:hypothetical protein